MSRSRAMVAVVLALGATPVHAALPAGERPFATGLRIHVAAALLDAATAPEGRAVPRAVADIDRLREPIERCWQRRHLAGRVHGGRLTYVMTLGRSGAAGPAAKTVDSVADWRLESCIERAIADRPGGPTLDAPVAIEIAMRFEAPRP